MYVVFQTAYTGIIFSLAFIILAFITMLIKDTRFYTLCMAIIVKGYIFKLFVLNSIEIGNQSGPML